MHAPFCLSLVFPVSWCASRLDFVRPLDERIPSDDEEDEDDDDRDDDSYKDDAESAASSSQSQSQGSRSKSRTSPRKPSPASRLSRPASTRGRKQEKDVPNADDGSEGGLSKGRSGKRGGGEDAGKASTCAGDEADTATEDGVDDEGDVTVTAVSTSPASDRHARRLRRRCNGGGGPPPPAESPAVATNASMNEMNVKPSCSQPQPAAAATAAATVGSPSRRSARLGKGRKPEGDWRVGGDGVGKGGVTGGTENGEKCAMGKEDRHEDQNEGLPFVQTVEDLRRFVRLEGSVVGHGNCMWADTFAHHVVARRLNITILFVDMVSRAGKLVGTRVCLCCCFLGQRGFTSALMSQQDFIVTSTCFAGEIRILLLIRNFRARCLSGLEFDDGKTARRFHVLA